MKIFGIMLVKNEVDIVGYVLKKAEVWCDKIFILDNGSTDGTWELIQSMKNDVITPWKQYFGDYHNGLRADVYNEFKHLSEPGDWWCYKLDADEEYAEDPRDFLAKIPKKYQWVFKQSLDFVFTKEDFDINKFTGNFEEDKNLLQYFKVPCWSEGRFFRYRKGLIWENKWNSHYPPHVGVMAPEKILVKHYLYRNPKQIQNRIDLRKNSKVKQSGIAWKTLKENWEDYLLPKDTLYFYTENFEELKLLKCNTGSIKQSFFKDTLKRLLIKLHLYN